MSMHGSCLRHHLSQSASQSCLCWPVSWSQNQDLYMENDGEMRTPFRDLGVCT